MPPLRRQSKRLFVFVPLLEAFQNSLVKQIGGTSATPSDRQRLHVPRRDRSSWLVGSRAFQAQQSSQFVTQKWLQEGIEGNYEARRVQHDTLLYAYGIGVQK
eukprot:scaffold465_cov153-Amphora_coffeaeformis.AAC.2